MCFDCIAEESGRFAEGLRGSKTIGPDVSSDDLLGDARIAIIVRLITRSTHGCGKQMGSNGKELRCYRVLCIFIVVPPFQSPSRAAPQELF